MTVTAAPTTDSAFRAAIGVALDGSDWFVSTTPTDAVEPPTFMVVPSNRADWLTPLTACAWVDALDVAAIVGRVDLGPDFDLLAEGVAYAVSHLSAAGLSPGIAQSAISMQIGGLDYLTSRISCHVAIVIEESP